MVACFLCSICFILLIELVTELFVDKASVSSCASVEQVIVIQVHNLLPDTLYHFYAISLTAAGPSYVNSSLERARTKSPGLLASHYALIAVAVVVTLIFVIVGVLTCIRCCSVTSIFYSVLVSAIYRLLFVNFITC